MEKEREDIGQQGSAIIEAVLCLTIFMTAIFTILSFINLCRAQAVISNAVDATAKEMSQYAYFYHLSGIEAAERGLAASTAADREKFNQIAGSTEALYKSFSGLGSLSVDDMKAAVNTALDGDTDAAMESIVGNSGLNLGNLSGKIDEMSAAMASIDDPIGFLKGVVVMAGMEGASMLKSQLIAAPLASTLIRKHFAVNGMDADAYLRTFGIDGIDALNFKMSTIFSPTAPDDIHLVVYYQMDIVNFMNFQFGKVTICKEAVTRAWLGGDQW